MYVDQIRGCSLARSGSARSAESIRRLDYIQSSFNNPKYTYTRACIVKLREEEKAMNAHLLKMQVKWIALVWMIAVLIIIVIVRAVICLNSIP